MAGADEFSFNPIDQMRRIGRSGTLKAAGAAGIGRQA